MPGPEAGIRHAANMRLARAPDAERITKPDSTGLDHLSVDPNASVNCTLTNVSKAFVAPTMFVHENFHW